MSLISKSFAPDSISIGSDGNIYVGDSAANVIRKITPASTGGTPSISAGGVISGTPTAVGTTNFKVQVTDSQTPTAAVDIASESITVNSLLSITTSSLTSGSVNVPYSA